VCHVCTVGIVCDVVTSVSLFYVSVSLSAREHISGTIHVRFSPNFSVCYLWPWLGPALAALRFVICNGCRHIFAHDRIDYTKKGRMGLLQMSRQTPGASMDLTLRQI